MRIMKVTIVLVAAVCVYVAGFFHGHIDTHCGVLDTEFIKAAEQLRYENQLPK